jgi:hypothetical protein
MAAPISDAGRSQHDRSGTADDRPDPGNLVDNSTVDHDDAHTGS